MLETRRVHIGRSFHCVTFHALGTRWSCLGHNATSLGGDGVEHEATVQSISCLASVAGEGGYSALVAQYADAHGFDSLMVARIEERLRWGEGQHPEVFGFISWATPALLGAAKAAVLGAARPAPDGFSEAADRAFAAASQALGGNFFAECRELAPSGSEDLFITWARDLVRVSALAGYRAAMERATECVSKELNTLRDALGGIQ